VILIYRLYNHSQKTPSLIGLVFFVFGFWNLNFLSVQMNDVHRAPFLGFLKCLKVFLEAFSSLKHALHFGVEQLGYAILVHFKVMRRGVSAVTAANTFAYFMSDT